MDEKEEVVGGGEGKEYGGGEEERGGEGLEEGGQR